MAVVGIPQDDGLRSRMGMWDSFFSASTETSSDVEDVTIRMAAAFLGVREVRLVEDWGCGHSRTSQYLGKHQQYSGIDGSTSTSAGQICALENLKSNADGILMRHVLEHNPNWEAILDNALSSFRIRMVLILFTPFQPTTRAISEYKNWAGSGSSMWDIGFARDDITGRFRRLKWTSLEGLPTNTQYGVEHMFFLMRD